MNGSKKDYRLDEPRCLQLCPDGSEFVLDVASEVNSIHPVEI